MTRAGPDPSPGQREGSEGGLQGDGLGDPQTDLRCAQQVGLHRRARVSHSSMASGWRVKGSWGEEDRPSSLRKGPPLTSWAQAWWARALPGLRSPVVPSWCWESGAWAPSSGPFIPSWAVWPPDRRNGQGASGTGRSWGGLFLGESAEPSGGGDVLFTALASWSPQTTRDSRSILLSPLGFPSGPCTRP